MTSWKSVCALPVVFCLLWPSAASSKQNPSDASYVAKQSPQPSVHRPEEVQTHQTGPEKPVGLEEPKLESSKSQAAQSLISRGWAKPVTWVAKLKGAAETLKPVVEVSAVLAALFAKGWGYAILIPTSIQADNGAGLTEGIIGLVNKGQPRKLDDWGALRAWAWGASRALDYFETDKSVDATQVGIKGLSRYGKAALVTMAYDPRFATAFVASSGEGGAKNPAPRVWRAGGKRGFDL